ncbi:hypothetical protein SBRCBS47491_005656 [Sporothrix bragantina]|uniref:Large ribosomal subunit protein mL50 n=1 Tax=Sporothrix bragantina TaxID=671064 RepID=A0ABP0BYT7_9PEZI
MRRISRLPKQTVADVASAARNTSSRCAFRCHATAPTTTASSFTTRPRTSFASASSSSSSQLAHDRFFSTSVARRQADPKQPLDDAAAAAESTELEADVDEWAAATEVVEDEPSLVVPGRIQLAPQPDQITDSDYIPAETGEGLEEVGGLAGWWENDQHWDQSVVFRGFGPQQHVTDAATLVVLARQAVTEAVAVQQQQQQKPELLTSTTWARDSDAQAALALQIEVAADGSVTAVHGDVAGVVNGLAAQEEYVDKEVSLPTAEQAQALVASWAEDASWKSISLKDVALKFAINKRILQLTGHMLPDAQLATADTVGALLSVLVRPPKAKKLAEELAADGALAGLPNVAVYGRRVTPIDKHKSVGRWKVIVEELEKRGLPVTGTGGYGKATERKWAFH